MAIARIESLSNAGNKWEVALSGKRYVVDVYANGQRGVCMLIPRCSSRYDPSNPYVRRLRNGPLKDKLCEITRITGLRYGEVVEMNV